MLGHETVAAGIAGPEIADDVVGQVRRTPSAATMESAQTGQVGRSHPRGSGLDATVDMTSAIAGIVTSLRSEPDLTYDDIHSICLTLSQHKCVDLTLFGCFPDFASQRILDAGASGLRAATTLSVMMEQLSISCTLPPQELLPWTRRHPRVQCTVPAGAGFSNSIVDADRRYADRPPAQPAASARGKRHHPRQAGIFQSRRQREGPHRRGDDHRDGEGRRHQCRYRADRADLGQYRHCARLRRGVARLPAEAGDAGIDVDRAAQDAGVPRRRNRC